MLDAFVVAVLGPLKALVRRFEGFRPKPYLCPAGVPTQGYGRTGVGITLKSRPISLQVGERWLDEDAAAFVRLAVKASPNLAADPDRAAAVADFVYNLGLGRYMASTLRRKVRDGDWPEAAAQLQKWVWGGGRKLPGLVIRRAVEADLLLRSRAPAPSADPIGDLLERLAARQA